jgi:MraZ protein
MNLFLGEYDHSLDDRGRVTLPRKIRQEITGEEIVLARGYEGCIFGFDKSSWEKEAGKHLDTPVTDEKGREVRRYLFAGAEKVGIDKLGRILLPAQLKEHGLITREVKVIGAGDHFEIWDTARWREYADKLDSV